MATLPLPPTTEVQITRVVKALYDAAPGNLYLQAFTQYAADNGGVVGVADGLLYEHRNKSNAEVAQLIVKNLGLAKVDESLGVADDPAKSAAKNAEAFLLWQFNVAEQTGATRGQVLVEALNNLATLGSDPIFGKAADYFNTSIAQAYSYSIDPANSTYDLAVLELADEVGVGEGGEVVPPAVPGMTFTLTAGADSLSPNSAVAASKTTSGDDVIRAVTVGDLATVDYVDAGDGDDTLNATMGAAAAKPVIKNVEIFNITAAAAAAAGTDTLDLGDVTGLKELNSTTTGANNAYYSNIALGTKLGLNGTTGTATNTFVFKAAQVTGAADSADLTLKGAAGTGLVTIDAIETINVTTSAKTGVAAANNLVLGGNVVENVNIAGDKAATIDLQGLNTTLVKVDASSATANLTVDLSAPLTNDVTVKLGSGADTIDFTGSGAKKVSLETGAGNDTIAIAAGGKHVLDLDEGKDTLTVTAITGTQPSVLDASTAAKLAASLVQVVDFTSGSDILRVDTTSGTEITLTGTQLTAIADTTINTDLLAAVTAAHAAATTTKGVALAAGDVTVFQYGADSYVLVEDGSAAATFDSADYLIKLVGVTSVAAADVVAI